MAGITVMDSVRQMGLRPVPTYVAYHKRSPTCRIALLDILFEGRAPSEGRLEVLLDRLERNR